jgi:hypothetical protein
MAKKRDKHERKSRKHAHPLADSLDPRTDSSQSPGLRPQPGAGMSHGGDQRIAAEPDRLPIVDLDERLAVTTGGPNSNDRPIAAATIDQVGGRLSVDNQLSFFGSPHVVLPPQDQSGEWSMMRLDDDSLHRMNPIRLIQILADLSPDVSRALWDFLRLCNPGYCITVLNKKGGLPDPVGQQMLEDFLDQLTDTYGSVDVVIGRLFMSAFTRGAIMAELVLDLDARTMVDLVTPDPASVRFIRSEDEVRGVVWQLAQWQNRPDPEMHAGVAGYVPLDWPTIRYVPIDPFPGVPYGRAIAAPAMFSTLFLLGMLHDLRRVIAQQGYPRIDISLDMEKIKASMPEEILHAPKKYKAWINDTLKEVQTAYARLKPSSTFVHTDVLTVNKPVGTVDTSSLGAIDGLIQALERMSTRALKTMPFMMASTQTTTETLANREWEVQTAGIRSIQKLAQKMLERLFKLGLQAQGHAAYVSWEFDQLRATEAMSLAQTKAIEISNEINMWAMGVNDLDTLAQNLGGHDAVLAEPLFIPKTMVPFSDPMAMDADTAQEQDSSHATNPKTKARPKLLGVA